MNIIHLLSQNHLTGAEVYAASLAQEQIQSGLQIYQISNGFFYPTRAIQFQLPVETNSKWQFIKNIFWLRNFNEKQNIHVIHSHSRAAAKLAFYATLFTRTAHVSTIHGVQHPSFSKKILNQYGQQLIAICENVKKQLLSDFGYQPERIHILPNPISENIFSYKKNNNTREIKSIAIIGRTTGPKAQRTEQCLSILLSNKLQNFNFKVTLIGGEVTDLNLPKEIKSQVVSQQHPQLKSEIYSEFDLIIGSGRVCMEALISGTPCIAFGEAMYEGLITSENFSQALSSNFGDISPKTLYPQINENQFLKDIATVFNRIDLSLEKLSKLATSYFSLKKICKKIQRKYESAYFLKNYAKWIPILMYHKIPNHILESQHKIFVTKTNFEKHLRFFKKFGFTTLTFSELALYRTGKLSFRSFPQKPLILTFDDGYRDNLDNASPLLKKYGFKAQIFLLANSELSSNKWDQTPGEPSHEIIMGHERLAWKNSAFEIGSHGFNHEKITTKNNTEAFNELYQSKLALEEEFQIPINTFAFTYGSVAENSSELAESAGYEYAVNTDSGGKILEEAPFAIFRVNIFPDENWWTLFKKTSSWYRKYYYFKRNK